MLSQGPLARALALVTQDTVIQPVMLQTRVSLLQHRRMTALMAISTASMAALLVGLLERALVHVPQVSAALIAKFWTLTIVLDMDV